VVWFALNEDRPLFAFAGIWTTFKGDRGTKSKPIPGPHQVYGFLTTTPNAVVAPIHPKAMPVILTTADRRKLGEAVGRNETAVLGFEPYTPMRRRRIADIGDRRAAHARRWRHAPAHCGHLATAVGVADHRGRVVRKYAGHWR
jgi:hypothetical protein